MLAAEGAPAVRSLLRERLEDASVQKEAGKEEGGGGLAVSPDEGRLVCSADSGASAETTVAVTAGGPKADAAEMEAVAKDSREDGAGDEQRCRFGSTGGEAEGIRSNSRLLALTKALTLFCNCCCGGCGGCCRVLICVAASIGCAAGSSDREELLNNEAPNNGWFTSV